MAEIKNEYNISHDIAGRLYVGKNGFFRLQNKRHNVNRKCTLCGGTREVTLKGDKYKCPKCNGSTTGEHWYSYDHYSLEEFFLESFDVALSPYWSDIKSVGEIDGKASVKLRFVNRDYDKRRGCGFDNNFGIKELDERLVTTEEKAFSDEVLHNPNKYFFLDKSLAQKVQRHLNKAEKEKVAHYVEEAKRLKIEASEEDYEF